jgi:arylsulfatase A-like enzyme
MRSISRWCKHSPFHVAVQAPLLVQAPGIQGGRQAHGLVEFVDIYPSLATLAGLSLPSHVQGSSFVPLLHDADAPGKEAVFPRWHGAESIQTDRYLYTEWLDDDGTVRARMLYDHETDPDETVNLAEQPTYAEIVADLHERLHTLMAAR